MSLGGAIIDVDEAATALPRRDTRFARNLNGGWHSGPGDNRVDWVRKTQALLTNGSRSAYVTFVGTDGAVDGLLTDRLSEVFEQVAEFADQRRGRDGVGFEHGLGDEGPNAECDERPCAVRPESTSGVESTEQDHDGVV